MAKGQRNCDDQCSQDDQGENSDNTNERIGAVGFGLNAIQQEAIADLYRWQERSFRSNVVLGGPLAAD